MTQEFLLLTNSNLLVVLSTKKEYFTLVVKMSRSYEDQGELRKLPHDDSSPLAHFLVPHGQGIALFPHKIVLRQTNNRHTKSKALARFATQSYPIQLRI